MNDTTWIWTSPNGRITHNTKEGSNTVNIKTTRKGEARPQVVRLYNVWTGKYLGEEGWFNSSRKDAWTNATTPAVSPSRLVQLFNAPNVVAVRSRS